MSSPSPTQPPPALISTNQIEPNSKPPQVQRPPRKKRMGERSGALFVKGILRPPIKGVYYLISAIKTHKLLTLGAILLLIASISLTTLFTTGSLPFGIGRDPWNLSISGGQGDVEGELIRTWLYALRDGSTTQLTLLDGNIPSNPPDPATLVQNYSEKGTTHLSWQSINVIGSYQTSDTVTDTIVEVDLSANGPNGAVTAALIWDFTTVTSNGQAILLSVNLASSRQVASS